MAVTMRDVAVRAGVSIATVSFVVNGSKPVREHTRLRIEQAMAELGFQRNVVARALASRQTRILALAYPALEHRLGWSIHDFVTSAAQGAADAGYHLVLWPVTTTPPSSPSWSVRAWLTGSCRCTSSSTTPGSRYCGRWTSPSH